MKLVPNWRQGWRWFSNIALTSIIAVNTAPIPPEIIGALPPDAQHKATVGLAVLGLIGRLIKQKE